MRIPMPMPNPRLGAIFRVENVFVDMTRYHYFSWRRLAEELGVPFTVEDNDRMRGIGTLRSLDLLLEKGGLEVSLDDKHELCSRKLAWLVEYLRLIGPADLLTGARELLQTLRSQRVPIAVLVTLPETALVLARLGIVGSFDAILDPSSGLQISPSPDDYRKAAEAMDLEPEDCLAFETTAEGISAAHEAGLPVVGIGPRDRLPQADRVVSGLWSFQPQDWFQPVKEAVR